MDASRLNDAPAVRSRDPQLEAFPPSLLREILSDAGVPHDHLLERHELEAAVLHVQRQAQEQSDAIEREHRQLVQENSGSEIIEVEDDEGDPYFSPVEDSPVRHATASSANPSSANINPNPSSNINSEAPGLQRPRSESRSNTGDRNRGSNSNSSNSRRTNRNNRTDPVENFLTGFVGALDMLMNPPNFSVPQQSNSSNRNNTNSSTNNSNNRRPADHTNFLPGVRLLPNGNLMFTLDGGGEFTFPGPGTNPTNSSSSSSSNRNNESNTNANTGNANQNSSQSNQNRPRRPHPAVAPQIFQPSSSSGAPRLDEIFGVMEAVFSGRAADLIPGQPGGRARDNQGNTQMFDPIQSLFSNFGDFDGSSSSAPPPATNQNITQLPTGAGNDETDGECMICLDKMGSDTIVKTLPCLHRFHADCIDRWLRLHNSCPICKTPVST